MKLEEARKQATPGPLRWKGTNQNPKAKAYLQNDEFEQALVALPDANVSEVDAALLAHCYNHFDEVVGALEWLVGFHQPGDAKALIDAEAIKQARAVLARAKEVQV
jgi:hypothetical protein